jgi:hypothetical protein
MKYLIPDNVIIFNEEDRDNFDQYLIMNGGIHCHHIEIRPKMSLSILVTHTSVYTASQDGTLRCWFSALPVQQTVIWTPPLDKFTLKRRPYDIILNTDILPSGMYFLNIQNQENRENTYECRFQYQ